MTDGSTERSWKDLIARANRIVLVRLVAAQVLLRRWKARPPRSADVARLLGDTRRILRDSGPRGLLRSVNAATHELALEGGSLTGPILARIHEALEAPRYRRWVGRYDQLTDTDLKTLRETTTQLRYRPLFSVLMPVYNTDEQWLRAAIESVRNQLYQHWELCIADDHSTEPRVGEVLREY